MKWLVTLLLMILSGVMAAQDSGTVNNIDDLTNSYPTTGWKSFNSPCILPSCNPGGSGIPTSTTQSAGNVTPSTDGGSMLFSQTAPSATLGTNVLWNYVAASGSTANVTNISTTFKLYLDSSFSNSCCAEIDVYIFKTSNQKNYMFGHQCNFTTGFWEVWNQLTTQWVTTSVVCNLSLNTWHTITYTNHLVFSDTNHCSGQPCMYFDTIVIDGVTSNLNMAEPSGPLSITWVSSIGIQFQSDVKPAGSSGSPVKMYVDEVTLSWNSSGSAPGPPRLNGIDITCLGTPLSLGLNRRKSPILMNVRQVGSTPITLTSSLFVHWDDDPNATTWTIKRSLTPGGPYTTLASGLTEAGCVDNRLKPKTTYYYVVSATNSIGTSGNSTEASGTTP